MALRIGLAVDESEGIPGTDFRTDLNRGTRIKEGEKTHTRAHAEVVAALGADAQAPVELFGIKRLLASRALRPYAFGHDARLFGGGRLFALDLGKNVVKPAHEKP